MPNFLKNSVSIHAITNPTIQKKGQHRLSFLCLIFYLDSSVYIFILKLIIKIRDEYRPDFDMPPYKLCIADQLHR